MRIDNVKAPFPQNAANLENTAHDIDRAIRIQGVHHKAGIAQARGELSIRLANRLKIMAFFAHSDHFFEDPVFLTAKTRRGFSVHNTQGMKIHHQ